MTIGGAATRWSLTAVLAFIVEWAILVDGRHRLPILLSPLLFYGASVLVCVAVYRHIARGTNAPAAESPSRSARSATWWARAMAPYLVALAGMIVLLFLIGRLIAANPLDARISNVIPAIAIYVERLLAGDPVYAPIHDFGYEIFPNYVTLQWLPFVLPEVTGIDYRWLPPAAFAVGYLNYVRRVAALGPPLLEGLVKAALPAAVAITLVLSEPIIFAHTAELMVVGFYYLAAAAVFSPLTLVRGLGQALPLLSRYALGAWLPLYLALVASVEGRRRGLALAGVVALAVALLYVVPFLASDPAVFARGQETYRSAAIGEWQNFAAPGRTYHIHNGLGFAVFVYELVPGSIAARVDAVRVVHLVASIAVVAAAAAWYFVRRPNVEHRLYALISLTLAVSTFYFFIQVPYAYLVMLTVFLSAFLLGVVPWRPKAAA